VLFGAVWCALHQKIAGCAASQWRSRGGCAAVFGGDEAADDHATEIEGALGNSPVIYQE
jgi:hypothetical protein